MFCTVLQVVGLEPAFFCGRQLAAFAVRNREKFQEVWAVYDMVEREYFVEVMVL